MIQIGMDKIIDYNWIKIMSSKSHRLPTKTINVELSKLRLHYTLSIKKYTLILCISHDTLPSRPIPLEAGRT